MDNLTNTMRPAQILTISSLWEWLETSAFLTFACCKFHSPSSCLKLTRGYSPQENCRSLWDSVHLENTKIIVLNILLCFLEMERFGNGDCGHLCVSPSIPNSRKTCRAEPGQLFSLHMVLSSRNVDIGNSIYEQTAAGWTLNSRCKNAIAS